MGILHSNSYLPMSDNFLYSRNGYVFVNKTARTSMSCYMACNPFRYTYILAYLLNLLIVMSVAT